jgi:hypothetical protein
MSEERAELKRGGLVETLLHDTFMGAISILEGSVKNFEAIKNLVLTDTMSKKQRLDFGRNAITILNAIERAVLDQKEIFESGSDAK